MRGRYAYEVRSASADRLVRLDLNLRLSLSGAGALALARFVAGALPARPETWRSPP
jgi:hypothetical protein